MIVRFSTRCPNSDYLGFETSPEAIVAAAKKAEEVGFDAIFVNDHIVVDSSALLHLGRTSTIRSSRCRLSLRTQPASASASRC
jgi:alkanesulfonate monooxygenase SsuD/methylene tetrahydromethanopterin reductase-like flavin-dependent oxidoreductase (luciferase family)